jgi:flagellar motor switch/type III secretory pathway protein FliN
MTMARWLPPTFLKTRPEVDLWNALAAWAGTEIPLGSPKSTLVFSLAEAPAADALGLLLQTEGGPELHVVPELVPLKAMFGTDIAIQDVQKLDAPLRDMINQGLVNLLWAAIPENHLGGVRIVASGPASAFRGETADLKWLTIVLLGLAAEPIVARIGVSLSALVAMLGEGGIAPARVASALAQRLTTEVAFTLGAMEIGFAALRQLAPGDLLVPAEMPADIALIRADWITYAFRAGDKGWTCVGSEQVERYRTASAEFAGTAPMSAITSDADHPAEPNVVIDFDLGRVTAPLSEVSGWKPGVVVGLNPPQAVDGLEVTLRINGQAVGTGDLVRVDNRIAVRITRLADI